MKNIWRTSYQTWLVIGIMGLALLALAFTGGDGDVDPAHCRPCVPPTPTHTPTLTPTPPLQACRVVEVTFDKPEYGVNEPMKITLRLADAQGAPLIERMWMPL